MKQEIFHVHRKIKKDIKLSIIVKSLLIFSALFLLQIPINVNADDTTPPTLVDFSFTPTTIDTSAQDQTVTVTLQITDNIAGFRAGLLCFISPTADQAVFESMHQISGDALTGTYQAVITFPRFSEAGLWKIYYVRLEDSANNVTNVFTSELTAMGFPTQLTVIGLFPSPVIITLDIKPGSLPNSINPKSKGKIPVGILSTPDFDAPTKVNQDGDILTFGRSGEEKSLAFCNARGEDINGDGLRDLVCHFETQKTGFQCGDTEGILKGKTVEDMPIEGQDSVRIIPCK